MNVIGEINDETNLLSLNAAIIAAQAAQTVVFQRTANFSMPARNRRLTPEEVGWL